MAAFEDLPISVTETYKVHLDDRVDISNIGSPKLEGERINYFCISNRNAIEIPPPFLPYLKEKMVEGGRRVFHIADVSNNEVDPMNDLYENAFNDPTLTAVRASNEDIPLNEALMGVDVISDRNVLRRVMKSCLVLPANAYFCRKEDFSVCVKFVNNKLIFHTRDRFEAKKGGFGRGLSDAILEFKQQEEGYEGKVDDDLRYYQVTKSVLDGMTFITRYQVDALDNDLNVVELKSRHYPSNPRYRNAPLTPDYYLYTWIQMALSSTSYVVLAKHDHGRVDYVEKLDLQTVQKKAQLPDVDAKKALGRMTKLIRWVKEQIQSSSQGSSSGQAILKYSQSNDTYELMILEESASRLPSISEEFEAQLTTV